MPEKKPDEEKSAVDRTVDVSQDVLKSLEATQRAALEAVRKFADALEEALPATSDRTSRAEEVVESALDMADKIVTAQYDFLRSVVRDAGRSLSTLGGEK